MREKHQANDAVLRRGRRPLRRLGLRAPAWAGLGWASTISAQMVSPPETVWGDVYEDPHGFQVGGVELLAGLLIALVVLVALCAFLAHQKRLASRRRGSGPWTPDRPEVARLRRQLMLCAFVATPLLGLGTIVLGGPRVLFGVEVALLGTALSALAVFIATAALVLERA
ncbi:MAG: hypothetical protein AAFX50_01665 [Acidobacteriota bacterium]